MRKRIRRVTAAAIAFLMAAATLVAQRVSKKILEVNGKTAKAAVVQIHGRSYIDIDVLAQVTNGSVTFQPDRIILTIPLPKSGAANARPPEGISRNFASAALVVLADMREWTGAVETMIQFQLPVTGTWVPHYQERTEQSLGLASVAASTPSDHEAFQLLQNEFSSLAEWAGNAVAARQALNATRTMNPDFLKNDPVLAKLSTCGTFLSRMLVSGTFADDPACH